MTVTSTTAISGPYDGNGILDTFDYTFYIASESELKVTLTDTDGIDSVETLTTDYTVTIGADGTGTFTMDTAPATGEKVTATLNVELKQETDLLNYGNFSAEVHETALDKLTRLCQQLSEKIDRCLKLGQSSDLDPEDVTIANLYQQMVVDTSNFDNVLSSADNTILKALETINDFASPEINSATATTQSEQDGSTKVATCEYADRAGGILIAEVDSGSGSVIDCYSATDLMDYDYVIVDISKTYCTAATATLMCQVLNTSGTPYSQAYYSYIGDGRDSDGNAITFQGETATAIQLNGIQGSGLDNSSLGRMHFQTLSIYRAVLMGNIAWAASGATYHATISSRYRAAIANIGGVRLYFDSGNIGATVRIWILPKTAV